MINDKMLHETRINIFKKLIIKKNGISSSHELEMPRI